VDHHVEGADVSTHPYGRITRRGMAGVLGLGFLELVMPGEAIARDEPPFRVYTRKEWGARPPRKPARVISQIPDRIVVHHTASANTRDYSLAQAYKLSRDIQRSHMGDRGWNDTGQQLTISRGGHVLEGRNRSLAAIRAGRHVVGAQTLNHNRRSIGIENEGTYSRAPVPSRLWDSLVETCVWLCSSYDLDPFRAIVGHRDLYTTDCPGDVLYAKLAQLRTQVAVRLDVNADDEAVEADPPSSKPSPSEPSPSPSPTSSSSKAPSPSPSPSESPSRDDLLDSDLVIGTDVAPTEGP
jgi:hypothetical protein